MKHFMETFCKMHNDHNDILEILLKENPSKFIQNALNYSAIDVKLIKNELIQVKFCKEIDHNLIEFIDLSELKGYKLSLALSNGVIPIKIKKYNDKIWYFKDNVITNDIDVYKYDLSPNKVNEINSTSKKYNLQFLNEKIIFKEHILNDMKTHVEEELLNEMRQKSDVGIELKENE